MTETTMALDHGLARKSQVALVVAGSAAVLWFAYTCATYLFATWVNVPYYDMWNELDLAVKTVTGSVGFGDIFVIDPSGHIALTGRLLTVASAALTGFDTRFQMSVGLTVQIALVISIGWMLRDSVNKASAWAMWMAVRVGGASYYAEKNPPHPETNREAP